MIDVLLMIGFAQANTNDYLRSLGSGEQMKVAATAQLLQHKEYLRLLATGENEELKQPAKRD